MAGQRAVLGGRQRQPQARPVAGSTRRRSATGTAKRYEFMPGKLLHGNDIPMTVRATISRVVQQEDINFLLTNRIPRRWLTLFVGWLSKIENPLISVPAIALWRLFCDVDLSDARARRFRSLHECFTRELKEGARPMDPDPATLVSPSDGIIGARQGQSPVSACRPRALPTRSWICWRTASWCASTSKAPMSPCV